MEHGALGQRGGAPGQVVFGERRSAFRRVATATTEFSGGHSRGDGGGSAATDGDGDKQMRVRHADSLSSQAFRSSVPQLVAHRTLVMPGGNNDRCMELSLDVCQLKVG